VRPHLLRPSMSQGRSERPRSSCAGQAVKPIELCAQHVMILLRDNRHMPIQVLELRGNVPSDRFALRVAPTWPAAGEYAFADHVTRHDRSRGCSCLSIDDHIHRPPAAQGRGLPARRYSTDLSVPDGDFAAVHGAYRPAMVPHLDRVIDWSHGHTRSKKACFQSGCENIEHHHLPSVSKFLFSGIARSGARAVCPRVIELSLTSQHFSCAATYGRCRSLAMTLLTCAISWAWTTQSILHSMSALPSIARHPPGQLADVMMQ